MQSRNIRRKFGQNYLSDPAVIFEMGQAISPKKQDYFFEIGPGKVLQGLNKRIDKSIKSQSIESVIQMEQINV